MFSNAWLIIGNHLPFYGYTMGGFATDMMVGCHVPWLPNDGRTTTTLIYHPTRSCHTIYIYYIYISMYICINTLIHIHWIPKMGYSIHLTGVYLQVFFATSTCRDALEVGKRLAGGFKHFSFFPIFHKSTRSRRVKYRMFMFVGMFFNTYFKRWSELKTVLVHRQISSDIYKFATID
jgi:hypothetical protein